MTDKKLPSVLAFEDRFPLSEKKLEKPFSDDHLHDLNQSAVDVLNAIIPLEQMSYEYIEPDSRNSSTEIQRIEQKVDFITELLARVLQAQQDIPTKKQIEMSAEYVSWCPEVDLTPGDFCLLSIFLSQKYPTPLEIPVEVIKSHTESASKPQVEAQILLTEGRVIDELTRLVFLYHRRQIARNREQS